jgi:nitrogen regulatory protein P-II 1
MLFADRARRATEMKTVVSVIKPFKLEEVTDALHSVGAEGITITDVRGHGRQRGHTEVYRGAEYQVDFLPKVRLEILCKDADVDNVVRAIAESARTGSIGDGKVWVYDVQSALRVRTGEVGDDAI